MNGTNYTEQIVPLGNVQFVVTNFQQNQIIVLIVAHVLIKKKSRTFPIFRKEIDFNEWFDNIPIRT